MNRKLIVDDLVEAWRFRRLEYGSVDCFQWVGEQVAALTGVDHRPAFPVYGSREEAETIIAAEGGVEAILDRCLGARIEPARAAKGDVVVRDFGDGLAPAVCLGLNCCTPGPRGLVFLPTAGAVAAWAV